MLVKQKKNFLFNNILDLGICFFRIHQLKLTVHFHSIPVIKTA